MMRAALGLLLLAAGLPVSARADEAATRLATDRAHAELFADTPFPSAFACRTCHPSHFEEWASSQHAYAQLSPIFNAMHGTVLKRTNGTSGDFCIRCHTPVGMSLGEPLYVSNLERHPVSREGITCVACHRMNREWGKMSGRMSVVEGPLLQPVYGPTGSEELERVLSRPELYSVVTEDEPEGRRIHTDVEPFFRLTEPGFCGGCHDVTLVDGFRLEEAFSEYKQSPAAARGETCQDCHMGKVPGRAEGYRQEPAANVGGVPTRVRKRTDHTFVGPDYPVVHPALFPHSQAARKLASIEQWLEFDWRAGWGTDEFEMMLTGEESFPEHWREPERRYEARRVIDRSLERRAEVAAERLALLREGYRLGEVEARREPDGGLSIATEVLNGTDGHNVPTGFTAERLVWLHTVVRDADGRVLFESGDLDQGGDLRNRHSVAVRKGLAQLDEQLFSLQSKFVLQSLRGGEREEIIAVNHSHDPLPFIRPRPEPTVLHGRQPAARVHKVGIPPDGSRGHEYRVPAEALAGARGPLTVSVSLKAGMVPVNLVAEIMEVGFDYGMTPREIARELVAGYQTLWTRELELPAVGGES